MSRFKEVAAHFGLHLGKVEQPRIPQSDYDFLMSHQGNYEDANGGNLFIGQEDCQSGACGTVVGNVKDGDGFLMIDGHLRVDGSAETKTAFTFRMDPQNPLRGRDFDASLQMIRGRIESGELRPAEPKDPQPVILPVL